MREILFRAKCLIDGRWIEGFYVSQLKANGTYLNLIYCLETYDFISIPINPHTVGQYTGLTDKNGKKIFEGDILRTYRPGLPVYKYVVRYYPEHASFMARCIETNTVNYLCDINQSAMEIIGNIHDNPELLQTR